MNSADLARQFIDALQALEQGDEQQVGPLVELFARDARLINAALKLAGKERQGHEGARQFWLEYRATLGQASSEFYQMTANDEAAGLFWTTKGSDSAGNPLEYDGVSLLVFDHEGKIVLFRGYYDTRQMERQISAG
jgi:ketosteroid isomerase-like protein